MPELHDIVNDTRANRWCGPSAVCTITGRPMSEVRAVLGIVGRKGSMGTYTREIGDVLYAFGYGFDTTANSPKGRPTLARWLRERRDRAELNLLVIGHHFVVVTGNRFCDSKTGKPVTISKAPGRRARVREVHKVVKWGKPDADLLRRATAAKPVNPDYTALRRLVRQHGGSYVLSSDGYFDAEFPSALGGRSFSTYHHGWPETFGRLNEAIRLYASGEHDQLEINDGSVYYGGGY